MVSAQARRSGNWRNVPVTFSTIFPGWYPGRAVHLNYRITRGSRRFSSQLFLPPSATSAVVATAPPPSGR